MIETDNIHATCVAIDGDGILILGKSGAGKSDLALRLIENKQAILVSDDRTDVRVLKGRIVATAPNLLKGLMEVRGVGIIKTEYLDKVDVKLVVNLVSDLKELDRMPEEKSYILNGTNVPMLNVYPFEVSATDKVVIKLKANLEK